VKREGGLGENEKLRATKSWGEVRGRGRARFKITGRGRSRCGWPSQGVRLRGKTQNAKINSTRACGFEKGAIAGLEKIMAMQTAAGPQGPLGGGDVGLEPSRAV